MSRESGREALATDTDVLIAVSMNLPLNLILRDLERFDPDRFDLERFDLERFDLLISVRASSKKIDCTGRISAWLIMRLE